VMGVWEARQDLDALIDCMTAELLAFDRWA
jgi:hypothetical protein